MTTVPIALVIPTYNRGSAVLGVLEKVYQCDPIPAEVWIHIDRADGTLEDELRERFKNVEILTSATRLGPGGGRHRCLLACRMPYAVSFDDNSYPVDRDFFGRLEPLFARRPRAAIFGASVWQRNEPEKIRDAGVALVPSYIGCGYAIRVAAYKQVRGTLPRPVPYGMEETDLSLQLFAAGWRIYEAHELRVLHDTDLRHRQSVEINAGSITNVGLFIYLHFPATQWGWGFLQVANIVRYSIRTSQFRGIWSGVLNIPMECYRNRRYRRPVTLPTLKRFLLFRRVSTRQQTEGRSIPVGRGPRRPKDAICKAGTANI